MDSSVTQVARISRTLDKYKSTHGMLIKQNVWWRHQMETFSALLAICAGNSPVPGEFPAQRPVTRSFDVFFDLRLNKRLSKQSCGRWFETLSRRLWRHCNESHDLYPIGYITYKCKYPLLTKTASLFHILWMMFVIRALDEIHTGNTIPRISADGWAW